DSHDENLPHIESYTDCIIYETSIRDFTIDAHSTIRHKGTYTGFIEEGRKTEGGHPAGFDYLKFLSPTHVQLLPIYDFKTVDELAPEKSYNWGYDPVQYFVPEGSYSVNVLDPFERIKEVQRLVAKFHENGMRIVQDVVYNHVYEYLTSPFEKVVPNYYFRKKRDGRMAATSGCGDDLASEKVMVSKLIYDACRWWIDFYKIDGFRFDLMGIIDCNTLNKIANYAKAKNPSFILYGEGWNMGGDVNVPLGRMDNHSLLPGYAFFNDRFREGVKRYLVGDGYATDDFKFGWLGSIIDYGGCRAMFENATQTINYVECHDNMTFYDHVDKCLNHLQTEEKLWICRTALACVLGSFGIPFIHMGQETAQSKFGKDNTYNLPDSFNKFSYLLLDERWELAAYCASLIATRKRTRFTHFYDKRNIMPMVEFRHEGAVLSICIKGGAEIAPWAELDVYINNTSDSYFCPVSPDRTIIVGSAGDIHKAGVLASSVSVPKRSIIVAGYKMEEKKA
nr:type I pullulanase [Bacilli bacterium]